MLASIGDAVGAPAALVLPKKCPSSSAVDSTSPQDRDWGNFLYKKREFSIQDIMIYHHIS